ncbi:MAG: hypothetical protein H0T80_21735 [Betaproteobacteria bacterium]|nr:hypothetical protein [Betaproteobacteria bacterium]
MLALAAKAKLVHHDGAEEVAQDLRAVASCADAGVPDLLLLALKAHAIAEVAPRMRALFGDDTMVVMLQNGLPWWYFQSFTGPYAVYRLKSADPNGVIEQNICAMAASARSHVLWIPYPVWFGYAGVGSRVRRYLARSTSRLEYPVANGRRLKTGCGSPRPPAPVTSAPI